MPDMKNIVVTALLVSLCVVLPLAFHIVQISANIFSPMHIPVLLCGLICGWKLGAVCGFTGPLLSSLLTGMPAASSLPAMTVELTAYGLAAGLMLKTVRTKRFYADIYAALIAAMLIGRVAAGITRAFTFAFFAPAAGEVFSVSVWITSYFISSLPGIITHLIIIPAIVLALMQARLIPARYPKTKN